MDSTGYLSPTLSINREEWATSIGSVVSKKYGVSTFFIVSTNLSPSMFWIPFFSKQVPDLCKNFNLSWASDILTNKLDLTFDC